jgi:hypothetical protein
MLAVSTVVASSATFHRACEDSTCAWTCTFSDEARKTNVRICELWLFAVAALIGCGDNHPSDTGWAHIGPAIELPLLEAANHSHEVSVIADGDHVAVAGMNIEFPSADSFEWGSGGTRRVAVWHSSDGGSTFSPADGLGLIDHSSDPVVLAGRPDEFLLGLLDSETGDIVLKRSGDGGTSWASVAETLPGFDKPWFAFDRANDNVFLCAATAVAQITLGGTVLSSLATANTNCVSAYVDANAFHYLTVGPAAGSWVGGASAPLIDAQLDAGDAANVFTRVNGSIGGSTDTTWIVRSMRTADDAPLVLELLRNGELTQRRLSGPGEVTFLPTAVMDEIGQLHITWYETSGTAGVLKYTRTATADLTGPLLDAVIVDDNACPGDRWYPYSSTEDPPGGRRLREYIGITATSERAFVAWTHAPAPPSRIHVARIAPRP